MPHRSPSKLHLGTRVATAVLALGHMVTPAHAPTHEKAEDVLKNEKLASQEDASRDHEGGSGKEAEGQGREGEGEEHEPPEPDDRGTRYDRNRSERNSSRDTEEDMDAKVAPPHAHGGTPPTRKLQTAIHQAVHGHDEFGGDFRGTLPSKSQLTDVSSALRMAGQPGPEDIVAAATSIPNFGNTMKVTLGNAGKVHKQTLGDYQKVVMSKTMLSAEANPSAIRSAFKQADRGLTAAMSPVADDIRAISSKGAASAATLGDTCQAADRGIGQVYSKLYKDVIDNAGSAKSSIEPPMPPTDASLYAGLGKAMSGAEVSKYSTKSVDYSAIGH